MWSTKLRFSFKLSLCSFLSENPYNHSNYAHTAYQENSKHKRHKCSKIQS
ncbi:hypothetical protein X975_10038, partial [Stegodyphus mimosarum]